MAGKIQGADVKTEAELIGLGATASSLPKDSQIYVTALSINKTLDDAIIDGDIGSGGGGVKNLIEDGNADQATTSIFIPYADAAGTIPVDGTGGSPVVTTSITTSSPLDGTKSFLLTKPSSNAQGNGWAVPFDVDLAFRGKSLKISVDYIVNSGTFVAGTSTTNSDVIWYIYDITNSLLIEPSNIRMYSNSTTLSDVFEATFQTSVTGTQYRLIAHVSTTSASAYELKVDNITVSPQVYVYGTPTTDWVDFTPTGTLTTNATYQGKYRRVGDSADIMVEIAFSGANTQGVANINMPSGLVIDTTKLNETSSGVDSLGQGVLFDASTERLIGVIKYNTTTSVTLAVMDESSGSTHYLVNVDTSTNTPVTVASGDKFQYYFRAPIVGWSSSAQMSDAADTRVQTARYTTAAGQSIPNTTITIVDFGTKVFDTHGLVTTGASWKFTAQSYGFYDVKASILFNSGGGWAAGEEAQLYIHKNNTLYTILIDNVATATHTTFVGLSGSAIVEMNAGDFIDIRVSQGSGASLALNASADYNHVSIERISGPQAIAATETVAMHYNTNAGQSIPNSTTTTVIFEDKVFDTHNAYNTSTGVYTVPATGKYMVISHVLLAGATGWELGEAILLSVEKNGTTFHRWQTVMISSDGSATSLEIGKAVAVVVDCLVGDTLRVAMFHNSDASKSVYSSDNTLSAISIARIGI